MAYTKKPKSEWKKPGPKPNTGTIGERIKKRIDYFNPLAGKTNHLFVASKDDVTRDFYAKSQEILNRELGKLYKKSMVKTLELSQIKTLLEMVKTSMVLDAKQVDLPQVTSPELVEHALKMLNASNEQPKEPENEPRSEDPETTDND